MLHDEQCIDGNVTFQLQLHLQQTLPLLCPEPYKHPKTTKLNLNATKEEGDGNKLQLLSSLDHHHKKNNDMLLRHNLFFLFFKHRKKGNGAVVFFFSYIEKKATTINCCCFFRFNTTIKEGDGSKLLLLSSVQQHHKRDDGALPSSFSCLTHKIRQHQQIVVAIFASTPLKKNDSLSTP